MSDKVQAYAESYFRGQPTELDVGVHKASAASLRVPDSWRVAVLDEQYGEIEAVEDTAAVVKAGIYLRVERCVVAWEGLGFTGRRLVLDPGEHGADVLAKIGRNLGSLRIPPRWQVWVYDVEDNRYDAIGDEVDLPKNIADHKLLGVARLAVFDISERGRSIKAPTGQVGDLRFYSEPDRSGFSKKFSGGVKTGAAAAEYPKCLIWNWGDVLNALTVLVNLVAVVTLFTVVRKLTKTYQDKEKEEQAA